MEELSRASEVRRRPGASSPPWTVRPATPEPGLVTPRSLRGSLSSAELCPDQPLSQAPLRPPPPGACSSDLIRARGGEAGGTGRLGGGQPLAVPCPEAGVHFLRMKVQV